MKTGTEIERHRSKRVGLSVKRRGRKWKTKGRNRMDGLRRAPGGIGSKVASSPSGICPCPREHLRTKERAAVP